MQSPRWFACSIAATAGGAAFFLFFSIFLRSPFTVPLRPDGPIARQGFYATERNQDLMYAWTGPRAEFTIPAIDRGIDWRIALDIRIWRPRGVPLPTVRIRVDGTTVAELALTGDRVVTASAPRRDGASGMSVTIDTTPSFAPGPRDTRKLGIAIASMTVQPIGGAPRAPWLATTYGALAIFILAAAVVWAGLSPAWVAAFAVFVAWGAAAMLARGVGPYGDYPTHVLLLAASLAAAFLAVASVIERRRHQPLSTAAVGAAAICLAACYLKLLMLLHPDMPIGDGVFHAHRFEYVLAGRLYFTSLTPDNYAFPYPIFLYLASAPFAWLTSDTLDRLALLRIVATAADTVAAALLYWMIVRATADKIAGLAAVLWYHAIPMTAWIMTWSALTNAFAQSLFVASLALVVGLPVERANRRTIVMLTVVAASALLTHPSTCAILVGVLAATSALYAWRGGDLRTSAVGVAVATACAAAVAVVLYYAWFPSVYVSELGRVASTSVAAASASAPPASFGTRLANALGFGEIYFGWAAVAAAAIGTWRLSTQSPSPRLTLLLVAWGGICLVFLAVGIVTPIEMRYHFAAFPALAIAAGFACSWAWRSGTAVRLAMSVLVVAGVWDGIAQWLWAMTTYARLVE